MPRRSIPCTVGYRPDHDIGILPFTRLSSWEFNLPTELYALISNEPDNSQHSLLYGFRIEESSNDTEYSHLDTSCDTADFGQWLVDTRTCLDNRLDDVPGKQPAFPVWKDSTLVR